MAETVVTAVIGDAVSRAISLLTGRFAAQQSAEAKLRRICHTLIRIHSAVEEARGRHITNDGVLRWLSELISGEHQGRYLLDTIRRGDRNIPEDDDRDDRRDDMQQVPLPRASSVSSLFNPAKRVRVAAACALKMALSRRDDLGGAAAEIDSVLESLQGVCGDLAEFILLLQGYQPVRRPLATNIFVDGQMFGRHVEKQRIINFLLHEDGNGGREDLGVLPIVGDVGAGKTTLVQHSCDDDRVRRHFAVIVFLSFSCTYATATTSQETAIISLRSKHVIGGDAQLSLKDDPLQWINRNSNGQRFLIVFEDVDMRKKQLLEELLLKLKKSSAGQGSKVIFTTANRRVSTLGTVEPIRVKFLPTPEYWFFFKAHAFAGRDLEESPRLVAAGKAIAKKLNGSFFGAKIVGGLLKDHPDPKFWCKVLRSNIGGLSLLGDGIGYIADLSQNLLPVHVDVCWVDVSKAPFAEQIELPRFQDLCERPHGWETAGLADGIGSVRVLLCKSVMPFHNQYYFASCTICSGNSDYVRAMAASSSNFLLNDI